MTIIQYAYYYQILYTLRHTYSLLFLMLYNQSILFFLSLVLSQVKFIIIIIVVVVVAKYIRTV